MRLMSSKSVSLGLIAMLGASGALAAGPFAEFGGAWKGVGRVSDVHGKSESLICKSLNSPQPDGIAMTLTLVCASDSYRVDFRAELYTDGQALRGTWTETSRDASGNITGSIRPDLITAQTTAPGFTANIAIRVTNGKLFDVTLNAKGTNVNHVEVAMKR
ncbi:MAG: hypothetical protein KGM15_02185 [Pseudomonadota bacterium]|nr:hypothetical protein [Pseudomonadota bacterium]